MATRSFDRRQLSRSKLDLFLECPRCFYEDVVRGNGRRAVRRSRSTSRWTSTSSANSMSAAPGRNRTRCSSASDSRPCRCRTRASTRGGATSRARSGSTAKAEHVTAETLHPAYRRQADVYQFPVAQQGREVSDRAWFVYANGLKTAGSLQGTLRFDTKLVPYDGDQSWVREVFRAAVSLVIAGQRPDPGAECPWCQFAAAWHA